jgi:hypothetical protein
MNKNLILSKIVFIVQNISKSNIFFDDYILLNLKFSNNYEYKMLCISNLKLIPYAFSKSKQINLKDLPYAYLLILYKNLKRWKDY